MLQLRQLALGGLLAIALALPAASASATHNCPPPTATGWLLLSEDVIIHCFAAEGFADVIRGHDRNADDLLCLRFLPNFPPDRFSPAFVYVDNNVQRGANGQGGCPPGAP
jgi:hypothetical protein